VTHRKALIKLIEANGRTHGHWQVFSDFVELSAIAISNAVDLARREAREARYLEIVGKYEREEVERFPRMLGELVSELECGPADVLGAVFMEMELGSKWHGQFFTPYELCRMMSGMMVDDHMRGLIDARGFIRANEPACGGGAMVIALAEEMYAAGIDYQQHLHVVAQDLDLKAVHMAYVQLSLLHIPAVVIHGNTLALEERSHWHTPAHIMGGWEWRLAAAERRAAGPIVSAPPVIHKPEVHHPAPPVVAIHRQPRQPADQLSLF
jgi:hypothetical protein